MYQTPTREPPYKRSTHAREPRHESREFSEETSSGEEEEETSDRTTEESDDTTESQESRTSQRGRRRKNHLGSFIDEFDSYLRYNELENFVMNPYMASTKFPKQDKITQKNLLSPLPSFLAPAVHREVSGPPYYRVSKVKPFGEDRSDFKNFERHPRGLPNKRDSYRKEENFCVIHENSNRKERKGCDKCKKQKDKLHSSRGSHPERVLTCLHSANVIKSSRKLSKSTAESESFAQNMTTSIVNARRPKTSSREKVVNPQITSTCPNCILGLETRGRARTKPTVEATPCEKNVTARNSVLPKNIGDGKKVSNKPGEVREKLVYVVEEEGKNVTKLETDLFTLNEILTIKKDLLELSEFAKKLKKLKEMKKESESGKSQGNPCHCKPAEELLRDVNRRIEALEARQEELERGSTKSNQKGETESESKKTDNPKTSSVPPSKTPVMTKPSAVTTVPSFPKTEMLVTRAEGFSNNSDIVNELMDIKTQLQKLEKRRMSKEVSSETVPGGDSRSYKKKDHAIAVFSSRTYILTSENFEKRKAEEKTKREEKAKNYIQTVKEKTRNEQTNENVANWLKNVSLEHAENDVRMFLSTEGIKRQRNPPDDTKGNSDLKSKNYGQVLKEEDFGNQEPQKNRAPERNAKGGDISFTCMMQHQSSAKELSQCLDCKKCFMTPSGRLFALVSKSTEKFLKKLPSDIRPETLSSSSPKLPPRVIRRSGSSGSVTSAILVKQQIRRMKPQTSKGRHHDDSNMNVNQSKSMQELNVNSSTTKSEKSARNLKVKDFGKIEVPKEKKSKEDKNEFVRRLEAYLMVLKKNFGKENPSTTSCSYSELLASINLETEGTPATIDSGSLQANADIKNQIFTYRASTRTNPKNVDSCCRPLDTSKKESRESIKSEKKQKEKKKKEKLKSECKKKNSKPKKESKSKGAKKKKECKEKKKEESKKEKQCKHKCHHRPCSCCLLNCEPSTPNCKNVDHRPHQTNCCCSRVQQRNQDCTCNSWKVCCKNESLNHCDSPAPPRYKAVSRDSLEYYRKRRKEASKMNLKSKKSAADSCMLKNILKNLSRLQPKLSNLQLAPFVREYCNKKPEELRRRKTRARECWKEEEEDEEDDVDDDTDSDESRSACSRESRTRGHRYHDQCHRAAKPDHLRNCRCVRVYLQSQVKKGWSGLRPSQKPSETGLTNSRTSETYKTDKSDFVFPTQKPHIFYVGHATERHKKKKKHHQKHHNKKCHKEKKHHKKHRHKKKTKYLCTCQKCGDVHANHSSNNDKSKDSLHDNCTGKKEAGHPSCAPENACSPGKSPAKNTNDTLPLFSFFSNFCKSKPRKCKSSKSILKKISEVRYLKTCPKIKKNFFFAKRCRILKSGRRKSTSSMDDECPSDDEADGQCCCLPKIKEIENRLGELERNKQKREQHRKKCRKKKKKKRCRCRASTESKHSENCSTDQTTSCKEEKKKHKKKKKKKRLECEGSRESITFEIKCKEGKKKKKEKKHKKHSKKKKKCGCSDSDGEKPKCKENCETVAYFHTVKCPPEDSPPQKKQDKSPNQTTDNSTHLTTDNSAHLTTDNSAHLTTDNSTHTTLDNSQCLTSGNSTRTTSDMSKRPTPDNSTTKTSTTNTSTAEGKRSSFIIKSKEQLRQKSRLLKERLPSLQSFWKNIKISKGRQGMESFMKKIRKKKSSNRIEPEVSVIDDCSKSSPMPKTRQVHELKEEPSSLMKKVKKSPKKEKDKKKKKEKQSPKSKPRSRRHQ